MHNVDGCLPALLACALVALGFGLLLQASSGTMGPAEASLFRWGVVAAGLGLLVGWGCWEGRAMRKLSEPKRRVLQAVADGYALTYIGNSRYSLNRLVDGALMRLDWQAHQSTVHSLRSQDRYLDNLGGPDRLTDAGRQALVAPVAPVYPRLSQQRIIILELLIESRAYLTITPAGSGDVWAANGNHWREVVPRECERLIKDGLIMRDPQDARHWIASETGRAVYQAASQASR